MDNFKPHPTRKTRSKSVDGFVRRAPVTKNNDSFKAPDGYNPRTLGSSGNIPDPSRLGRRPAYKNSIDMSIEEPAKQKKGSKKSKKWKPGIKKGFLAATTLALLFAGFLVGFAFLRANQIFQGGTSALALDCEVAPELLKSEGDGRVNVLLLGKGGPGHDGADLTDTIMVASIDTCQKEIGLLSIPRDLYVQMPGDGSMKINAIYATAKQQAIYQGKSKKEAEKIAIKSTEKVAEEVTGLPIHYYAMVDFEAFRKAIDTVGGIDINVKNELYDPTVAWENNWSPVIAKKGMQHFDGKKALLYSRSRHGSARGDFDRAERQREVLVALRDKALSLGTFGNPLKLSQLIDAFGRHAETDLSVDDIMKLYEVAQDVEDHKVTSIGLADPPNDYVTTDNIAGLSVVIPKAGLYDYSDIQSYVRTKLKDGYLKKENASVIVLNGTTTPGLATKYSKILKGYGYNVAKTGDAPTRTYEKTQVIDLRNGDKKYTKRYLELRFKTEVTGGLPSGVDPGAADFVIILGKNETSN